VYHTEEQKKKLQKCD